MDLTVDTGAASSDPLTLMSHDFSLPVYQVSGPPSLGRIPEVTMSGSGSISSFSAASSAQSSLFTQPSGSNQGTSSVPPASPTSASGSLARGFGPTQMERNHTRLKAQYAQAKSENARLLQEKSANRVDLEQVESILEEVLDSRELSERLFERLSQVPGILMAMKNR
ncbi:hypothetical protein B0T10DRAFT_497947 [Thelonectria olida]|uniref:Uncharacterized protein n=1 Tax=Thelonectria olida TaxID=1576542 RepID=A0A9P8VW92_9HYPO|nr:hypothetical protein B0T10DRAFT_497947 [Thelonectria olida]